MKPSEGIAVFLTLIHIMLFVFYLSIRLQLQYTVHIYLLINELLGTAAHTSGTGTLSEQSVVLVAGLLCSLSRSHPLYLIPVLVMQCISADTNTYSFSCILVLMQFLCLHYADLNIMRYEAM